MSSLTFVTQCTLYWNVTRSLSMFLHTPQLVIKLLITLHSFLTWGNKACNVEQMFGSYYTLLTVVLTVTNTIDLLLWTLMVHLWSQWQRMLLMNRWLPWGDRQWGSSACADSTGVRSGPGPWWLVSFCFQKRSGYHLYTLPFISWHSTSIRSLTFNLTYIGIGMAVNLKKKFQSWSH